MEPRRMDTVSVTTIIQIESVQCQTLHRAGRELSSTHSKDIVAQESTESLQSVAPRGVIVDFFLVPGVQIESLLGRLCFDKLHLRAMYSRCSDKKIHGISD